MNVICNRRQSTKDQTTLHLILITFTLTALLFSVDYANAQVSDSYRLIGMIKSRNFTGIVLSDSKGEQSFYQLADKMPDGSQIVEVRSDSISVRRTDGTLYDMYISQDIKTATSFAPAKPDVPAVTYRPGSSSSSSAATRPAASIQNIDADRQNSQGRPRGRVGRKHSDEE
jgi:hypothetical protein